MQNYNFIKEITTTIENTCIFNIYNLRFLTSGKNQLLLFTILYSLEINIAHLFSCMQLSS
jgi:hypothetical protein